MLGFFSGCDIADSGYNCESMLSALHAFHDTRTPSIFGYMQLILVCVIPDLDLHRKLANWGQLLTVDWVRCDL